MINDTYYIAQGAQENNIMTQQRNNETRTSGTDVSNLGDNSTMIVKTSTGKEIELRLYGR